MLFRSASLLVELGSVSAEVPGLVLNLGRWKLPLEEAELWKYLKKECPEVVYGRSLPWMPKDAKEEDLNRKQAEIYKYQLDKQKHFIHEAPIDANFWRDPVVRAALYFDARVVRGPSRIWRLAASSGRRLASREIRTNWLVSDPALAAK